MMWIVWVAGGWMVVALGVAVVLGRMASQEDREREAWRQREIEKLEHLLSVS